MGSLSIIKVIAKSVFTKPATRLYPFVIRDAIPGSRGSISIEIGKCTFCTLCQKKCPTGAIVVKRQEKIWEIDRLRCISCAACVEACPKKCLQMLTAYSPSVTVKGIDSFTPPQGAEVPKEAVAA